VDLIAGFKDKVRAAGSLRVIFPEGHDERVQAAARQVASEGWATAILVAPAGSGPSGPGLEYFDPAEGKRAERYAEVYRQGRPDTPVGVAARVVRKPLVFGGAALAAGDADCMIGGAANPTSAVISAAALTVGLAPGIGTPSSFFLMDFPDYLGQGPRTIVYADCGVNIQPNAEQLADIAIASARSARALLGMEPCVAMLSFSTKGSGTHPDADKVISATEMVQRKAPEILVDGELQADSAIIARVAARKCPESAVAGRANVLVFPDLDAGNIAYKLSQYLGKARAYGPILQGFTKPCSDLSRGATVEDIVGTAAIVAAVAAGQG
jgi:phosphate acetyltransferase